MPFTRTNIRADLEDLGPKFDGAPGLIGLTECALSYQSVPRARAFRTATRT